MSMVGVSEKCKCFLLDELRTNRNDLFKEWKGREDFERACRKDTAPKEYLTTFGTYSERNFSFVKTTSSNWSATLPDNQCVFFEGKVVSNAGRHNLGGMRALCTKCGRLFFVKFVNKDDYATNPIFILDHPNLVKMYDVFSSQLDYSEVQAIIMEYIEEDVTSRVCKKLVGETLEDTTLENAERMAHMAPELSQFQARVNFTLAQTALDIAERIGDVIKWDSKSDNIGVAGPDQKIVLYDQALWFTDSPNTPFETTIRNLSGPFYSDNTKLQKLLDYASILSSLVYPSAYNDPCVVWNNSYKLMARFLVLTKETVKMLNHFESELYTWTRRNDTSFIDYILKKTDKSPWADYFEHNMRVADCIKSLVKEGLVEIRHDTKPRNSYTLQVMRNAEIHVIKESYTPHDAISLLQEAFDKDINASISSRYTALH